MILLSGSVVLPFASTQHVFHSPVLGNCFVCRLLLLARLCVFGAAVSVKMVFFVFLFINVMSDRLKGIVSSVTMLRFQYSLKFSLSITLAGVYL